MAAETMPMEPPKIVVKRAPKWPAIAPEARLPNGPRPTIVMPYMDMMRPRYSSRIKVWIVVFAEVSLGRARDSARVANALKDNQTNVQLRLIENNRAGRT